ncbi:MAG: hypothetical protein WBO97_14350, partial [Tepidiformaceae bacterium]
LSDLPQFGPLQHHATPTGGVLLAGWNDAVFHKREGSVLLVEVLPEHTVIAVDLTQTAVFDCRINCLEDVRSGLEVVDPSDQICLYSEANRGLLKLWINRYTCPVLGG